MCKNAQKMAFFAIPLPLGVVGGKKSMKNGQKLTFFGIFQGFLIWDAKRRSTFERRSILN
jgi:hypothetical protein